MMRSFIIFIISCTLFSDCFCDISYELDVHGTSEHGYYITVYIGSPPQKINLLPDTGSSNMAVAVTPVKSNNSYFHFNESSTFVNLNTEVEIQYVEGQWNGFLGSDFVQMSLKDSPLQSTLACMINNSKVFDINSKFSGLLGLAYSSIAKPNSTVTPLLDLMVQTKNMSDIFAFNLCGPNFFTTTEQISCGKLHLGYFSQNYYSGEAVYTPIVKQWFYEVVVINLKIGSKLITDDCMAFNKPRTIIDTGTTCLHLPKTLYLQTVQEIKNFVEPSIPSNYWYNETTACISKNNFNISAFPIVTLSLYHSKNSYFHLYITPDLYLLHVKLPSINGTCFNLGFAVSDVGTIIGSTVLKGFYVIFDRAKKQVGFANSTSKDRAYLPISVSIPQYTSNNLDLCKSDHSTDDGKISVGTIIWLIIALGTAIWLLFMLVIWIRTYLIRQSDSHSDTSSLVDE